MELAAFAELTRKIIRDNGFDEFIPVACLPDRRELRGLDGLSRELDVEKESIAWANSLAEPSEEFLLAFKVTATQFKVIRRLDGVLESAIYAVQAV